MYALHRTSASFFSLCAIMIRPKSASGPKKLVIKPFKEKPKLPENFEDESWEKLRSAVVAVHSRTPVASSFQELYTIVQDMCSHNLSAKLFSNLQVLIEDHTQSLVSELVNHPATDAVDFLDVIDEVWTRHCSQMTTIREIFMFLDRSYVLSSTPIKSLWEMGVAMFRNNLKSNPEIEDKTLRGLLVLIRRERNGDAVSRLLLKSLLRMYSSLQTYFSDFLPPFLAETADFYREESQRLLGGGDAAAYLKHVEKRLSEEIDRVNAFLAPSTRKPLVNAVERELLEQHVATIVSKGFDLLMAEKRTSDLARMYHLLARVNALPAMKVALVTYIKRTGGAIVTNEEQDKEMVNLLLEFKETLDTFQTESFENNEEFQHGVKDAFESFINMRPNKPAELVAKFIDSKLRAGNSVVSDDELDSVLDKVMVIFRYIAGKDVFEAFYKKDLAKRLLLGRSSSIDAEKSMIAKLKQQCGSGFTSKLEGMFKDIDLSYDIMVAFKDSSVFQSRKVNFDVNIHVLTTGYWPPYPPLSVTLPRDLKQCEETFGMFYLSKHSGRKLTWQNTLGHCLVKGKFPMGEKELQLSLFQTVILLLFNASESLSFREIADALALDDKELRVTLQSLACGKTRVLTKKPKGKDVLDTDSFEFNSEFQSKLRRIKVNTIQLQETPEEAASTTEKVFEDRQYQIDAAIVRIMKARKSLAHQPLILELCKQLKFPVAASALKKRIENLISREYLERDASNASLYHYVA